MQNYAEMHIYKNLYIIIKEVKSTQIDTKRWLMNCSIPIHLYNKYCINLKDLTMIYVIILMDNFKNHLIFKIQFKNFNIFKIQSQWIQKALSVLKMNT